MPCQLNFKSCALITSGLELFDNERANRNRTSQFLGPSNILKETTLLTKSLTIVIVIYPSHKSNKRAKQFTYLIFYQMWLRSTLQYYIFYWTQSQLFARRSNTSGTLKWPKNECDRDRPRDKIYIRYAAYQFQNGSHFSFEMAHYETGTNTTLLWPISVTAI